MASIDGARGRQQRLCAGRHPGGFGALTGLKNPQTRRQPKRRKMAFEPLDQRLLLSGTPDRAVAIPVK